MIAAGFVDWAIFWTVVTIALVADIVVARRGRRTPTVRNGALWSGAWIGLGAAACRADRCQSNDLYHRPIDSP